MGFLLQGVADDVRAEVWKFILGVYPWNSTHSERATIRAKNVELYFTMRRQWESMTPAQENRFTDFKDRKSLIGKMLVDRIFEESYPSGISTEVGKPTSSRKHYDMEVLQQ